MYSELLICGDGEEGGGKIKHTENIINPLCPGEHHHRRRHAYCYNRIKCTVRSAFCVRRQRQRLRRRYNIRNPFVCIPAVSSINVNIPIGTICLSLSLPSAYPVLFLLYRPFALPRLNAVCFYTDILYILIPIPVWSRAVVSFRPCSLHPAASRVCVCTVPDRIIYTCYHHHHC